MKGILKALISSFLGMFLHEVLVAQIGKKLFHDHVTVLSADGNVAVTEIDIADGYRYKVTIEHVKEGEQFVSEKAAS